MKVYKNMIFVATKARGIFRCLFSSPVINAEFIYNSRSIYDSRNNSKIYKMLLKIFYSHIFDVFGVIQRIRVKNKVADLYWSYNRFLQTDKSYILYVEHPVALYHYRLLRGKSRIGKYKLQKYLNDSNLKAIVFQAKFSAETFEKLCGEYKGIKKQIYPMICKNNYVDKKLIVVRCHAKVMKLLFVAQGSRFVSKSAPELLEAFKQLNEMFGETLELTVLTAINEIDEKYIENTKYCNNICWRDYTLSSEEMSKLYADTTILIVVSSDDSLNAVALEAIKAGIPIIASKMSGFPEMIEEGVNGFMIEPKWWFFDQDNYPNPAVWNHRKDTIYSVKYIDDKIVHFIIDKVSLLVNDRELLTNMSLASYIKAHSAPFSEEYIVSQWNELIEEVKRQEPEL